MSLKFESILKWKTTFHVATSQRVLSLQSKSLNSALEAKSSPQIIKTTSEDECNEIPSESNEDLVVQRINELFFNLDSTVQPQEQSTLNLRSDRKSRGFRKLHRVSGYFNDWAKWLTTTSNPSSEQCNNSNIGYILCQPLFPWLYGNFHKWC